MATLHMPKPDEADKRDLAAQAAEQKRQEDAALGRSGKIEQEPQIDPAALVHVPAVAGQPGMPAKPAYVKPARVKVEPGTRLVATEIGFYAGSRIRPGQEFTFDGKFMPRWAALPGSPEAKPKKVDKNYADTKPAIAAAAAKAKIGKTMDSN